MRVAFVTFEFPPRVIGGAGIYAGELTSALAKNGHEIVVFTPTPPRQGLEIPGPNNVEVHTLECGAQGGLRTIQFWTRLPKVLGMVAARRRFDVVHVNSLSYWYLTNRRLGCAPQIVTIHHLVRDAAARTAVSTLARLLDLGGENGLILPLIERKLIDFVDHIIADSEYTRAKIIETYAVNPAKITTIRFGLRWNESRRGTNEGAGLKGQIGLPEKPMVLFVGRVDAPRKGLPFLLSAFKKVLETIDATLLIVGSGNTSEAEGLAKRLGLSDNVMFAGAVDDPSLRKCYAACDVFACPSTLEGFGLTVLEAISEGKPVVATRVGAIPEIVPLAQAWSLTEPGNVGEFADALCYHLLIAQSPAKSAESTDWQMPESLQWPYAAKAVESVYAKISSR